MFKSVSIQNFRGIKNLEINDLGKINIFVGDNATGKTAVLDAIYILINPNNPELPKRTNDWRNLGPFTTSFWRSFFYNFDYNNEIILTADVSAGKRELLIKPKMYTGTMVVSEDKPNGEFKAGSELEKNINGLILRFKIDSKSFESDITQESLVSAKLNPDQKYHENLKGNYFNNINYANEVDVATKFDTVNKEVGKEAIINFLKSFKPSIEDIELDRFQKLIVKDTGYDQKRVHLNTYGDGLVRGLHIILDALAKSNAITLIDEVENGLHWSKQEVLWKFLHKFIVDRNLQIFASTHSKEMVDHLYQVAKKDGFLKIIKLYRLQAVNGLIKLVQYEAEELEFALTHGEEFR